VNELRQLIRQPNAERQRDDLLVTVASLYYELNQNQRQIAERLDMSRSSVSRLIKEARDSGIVEIRIHKPVYRNYALEQTLIEAFGLHDAYVLITDDEKRDSKKRNDEILWGVGQLACSYLRRVITTLPPGSCIGISWGTGVYAAVHPLPEDRSKQIDVVQVLGSIGAPDPLIDGPDLARMAADKLGGRNYGLHAPALVEQTALRDLLLAERSVRDGLERARTAALAIIGIGSVQDEAASYLRAGLLTRQELAALRAAGVVGETCGRFFDAAGEFVHLEINRRVIGIELSDLRKIPRVIAVARGLSKLQSILGALRGRYLKTLATDDVTAQAILAQK
jgi:DNA-binding transcriptional regulator LsrR (DeoR family)